MQSTTSIHLLPVSSTGEGLVVTNSLRSNVQQKASPVSRNMKSFKV